MTRASIATAALFALACLPDRDNKHDPAIQPSVVLTISPGEGNRQTAFTLDASQSTGRGALTYCWDLDDNPSDYEIPCGSAPMVTTSNLSIPVGGLGGFGEGGYEKTVRVTVKSRHAEASGSASVLVTNTRPVVDAGPDIVTAAGQSQTVHLDGCAHPFGVCTSFDPDGDDVEWRWRQVGGTPVVLSTNGTFASFTAPPGREVLYFELVGDDGLATARARTTVRVGTVAWVTTLSPSRIFRVHPEIHSIPLPPEVLGPFVAPYPAENGDLWIDDGTQIVRIDASGSFVSRFAITDYTDRIVPRGDSACLLKNLPTPGSELGILRAPTSGVDGTYVPVSIPGVVPIDVQQILADPEDPSACILAAGTKGAFRVHLDGTSEQFIADSAQVYLGADSILTRDGSFWSAYFIIVNGEPRLSIYRVGSDGSRVVHRPPTGGQVDGVFALDDSTVVVIGKAIDGAGRYAYRANAGGFEPLAVPPLTLDLISSDFVSLPDGSIFVWVYPEQTLRRLRVRGHELEIGDAVGAEEFASGEISGKPFADVWNGGVVLPTAGSIIRVSSALRKVEQIPSMPTLGVNASVSLESSTGSLWVSAGAFGGSVDRMDGAGRLVAKIPDSGPPKTLMPRTAAHPDGSVSVVRADTNPRRIETYGRGGALLSAFDVPLELYEFDSDADGNLACAWSPQDGLTWKIAQTTLTPVATGLIFPIGASTHDGHCWFFSGSASLRYDDTTFTAGGTLAPSMKTDPRDGTLWIADANAVDLRHYSKAGALLGSVAGSPVFDVEQKCATGPGCLEIWTTDGADLVRKTDAGVELDRIELPIFASGLIDAIMVAP